MLRNFVNKTIILINLVLIASSNNAQENLFVIRRRSLMIKMS